MAMIFKATSSLSLRAAPPNLKPAGESYMIKFCACMYICVYVMRIYICYRVVCYIILYYIALYFSILDTLLYCFVLHCTVSYHIILTKEPKWEPQSRKPRNVVGKQLEYTHLGSYVPLRFPPTFLGFPALGSPL